MRQERGGHVQSRRAAVVIPRGRTMVRVAGPGLSLYRPVPDRAGLPRGEMKPAEGRRPWQSSLR